MTDCFTITDVKRIILVDKYEYPQSRSVYGSNLGCYELIYKFSGSMLLNFDSKQYVIESDTVYILPKGEHNNYSVERAEPGDCIDIFFDCSEEITSEVFIQKVTQNSKIGSLFTKAFSAWVAKNRGYYLQCTSIIYQILYEIQNSMYVSKDKELKIKPALDYIYAHFLDEDISCEYLAEICEISYSYLKKLFVEQYKLTPNKYINKLRINYACDLLREKRHSITEIAGMSGFSDVFYFCKCFKKNVGITPTQFKNNYVSSK